MFRQNSELFSKLTYRLNKSRIYPTMSIYTTRHKCGERHYSELSTISSWSRRHTSLSVESIQHQNIMTFLFHIFVGKRNRQKEIRSVQRKRTKRTHWTQCPCFVHTAIHLALLSFINVHLLLMLSPGVQQRILEFSGFLHYMLHKQEVA